MAEYGVNREAIQLGCIGIGFAPYSLTVAQYGALGRSGSDAFNQPVGTSFTKLTNFNITLPSRLLSDVQMAPEGVNVANDGQGLIVATDGLYSLYANIPATLSVGRTYELELFVDGLSEGLGSGVDLSNQSSHYVFNVSGVRALAAGQEITVVVKSDLAAQQFIMLDSSEFGLFRIR